MKIVIWFICLFIYLFLIKLWLKQRKEVVIGIIRERRFGKFTVTSLLCQDEISWNSTNEEQLQQTQYIIIFDFFYADHSILKPDIATQHNILYLVFGGNPDNI